MVVRSLFFGLLFGLGLILSGMTDPAKVFAFLDVAGAWDPSLAFVMGGAVLTAAPFFWIAGKRSTAVSGDAFETPDTNKIDGKLLAGAALFGIGWGLVGICPGPGLVVLAMAPWPAIVFVLAMIAGLCVSEWMARQG